ncbi:MAG: type II toxin-antitoxin system HipA family toxin [Alteromonadaceae bacterium]|nr:type II toxin-antitoxin system HipA family toxin [Alteromonadaceae bacterium]
MATARRISKLHIWMNGVFVGYWQKKLGVEELQYVDSWVESEIGRPLSISLPFTPDNQKHRGDKVKFYFDNLLPDSTDIRERLAQKFGSRSASPFDLLVELGRDCVGAIQLLPPGEEPENIDSILYEPLSEKQVANILRKTVSVDKFGQNDLDGDLRISLAGAQEKTALLWHDNQWCFPLGATPTTHIFKLPLGLVGDMKANMNESVENEWLCSKIIDAYDLPVAQCDIDIFEDQKALIVERFDRKYSLDKTWLIRLPQEDMCQAQGISPIIKYQKDGGLGIVDCMKILDGAYDPVVDKKMFFEAQVIFWLLFVTDGHCKNFSIHHLSKDQYRLTPLYDILSVHPLIGRKNDQIPIQKAKMAMALRGSKNYYLINKIQRRHFIAQAVEVGISAGDADRWITDIINSTESVVQKIYKILPDNFPMPLADKILKGMLTQSKKLAKMSIK